MEEVIGYASRQDVEDYIVKYLPYTGEVANVWQNTVDTDQRGLLLHAFEAIDRLPFRGRKARRSQKTAFPRYPQTAVPDEVVRAQVVNALALLMAREEGTNEADFYSKLRMQGIKSYRIGNLSETLADHGGISGQYYGIASEEVLHLLKKWLTGGYSIL